MTFGAMSLKSLKSNKEALKTDVFRALAEMERFELSQVVTPLPHFECGPFNHLGTSPQEKYAVFVNESHDFE